MATTTSVQSACHRNILPAHWKSGSHFLKLHLTRLGTVYHVAAGSFSRQKNACSSKSSILWAKQCATLTLNIMGNKMAILIFLGKDVRILLSELVLVIWHIVIRKE